MARYTGPKVRVSRRLGINIYENEKGRKALDRRPFPPGAHGRTRRRNAGSEYLAQVKLAQKCGWAVDDGYFSDGVLAIAAPVCDASANIAYTVSAVMIRSQHGEMLRQQQILGALQHGFGIGTLRQFQRMQCLGFILPGQHKKPATNT